MKSDLWIVFAVTAGFLGFLMGYGVPPMQEIGISAIGHGGSAVEKTAEADPAMDQYEELQKLVE